MILNIVDYKKAKKYDKDNRGCGLLEYSEDYTPNGILQCYKNKEYMQMEFKSMPIIDELILLPNKKGNSLVEWIVAGIYHFNKNIFVVVRAVNSKSTILQPYIYNKEINLIDTMIVNILDNKKVEEYDEEDMSKEFLQYYENKDYKQMKFNATPRENDFILFPNERDTGVYYWEVKGIVHFNNEVFIFVKGIFNILDFI